MLALVKLDRGVSLIMKYSFIQSTDAREMKVVSRSSKILSRLARSQQLSWSYIRYPVIIIAVNNIDCLLFFTLHSIPSRSSASYDLKHSRGSIILCHNQCENSSQTACRANCRKGHSESFFNKHLRDVTSYMHTS